MVIGIYDIEFSSVLVVTFMAVALMGVKVYDQKALVAKPLFHVVRHKSDVWIDAEATAL